MKRWPIRVSTSSPRESPAPAHTSTSAPVIILFVFDSITSKAMGRRGGSVQRERARTTKRN
eukprot:1246274-Prymnesium_polylepis.1